MQGKDKEKPVTAEERFRPFLDKMQQEGLPAQVIEQFRSYYRTLLDSRQSVGTLAEDEIRPVGEKDVPSQENLGGEQERIGRDHLQQTVMIKVNGGLGTSMGMPHAKSLLTARPGYTFLDIILLQARSLDISLLLMDSFHTREDVVQYWERQGVPPENRPRSFVQHKFPKVSQNLEPASRPERPELEWNPPGHGDVFAALETSGCLDELLEQGKRYAFISNSDNLGSAVDPGILGYMVQQGYFFLMEVAERYPRDKKGGHLALSPEGNLLLREIAQCPESDLDSFQDVHRHRFFNTNNIWIDLYRLKAFIRENGLPQLPLIVNPKTLDPRDETTPFVLQLETAMGAAIGCFPDSSALKISRDRFMPVKKTSDLLAVRSDCFILDSFYKLSPNPERDLPPIHIELDGKFYGKVDHFEARFPHGPPSLLACESLSLSGDILFDRDVRCKGRVEVVNNSPLQQVVQAGSELSGRVELP
ncbi:MAG: UTP--glucose-1-phosphate uridylyltransferase [Desulfohalobiaceae bacterium]|nr:UTP--glucose-1-phosphate uridylyltransferase [Desulfohalobiaceae bacterium]